MFQSKGSVSSESKEEIIAFLGKGTEFEGKLTFEGTVRIDGKFSGEIFTKGVLIFGESSQIEAEVEANKVVISGEIRGNVNAATRVEIHTPGKVYGNIKSPVLVIDDGVVFEGNCQMESREGEKQLSILKIKEKEEELLEMGDSIPQKI